MAVSAVYGVRIDVVEEGGRPVRFTWNGRVYAVRRVIDHWVTLRADHVAAAGGRGVPQRRHWRVEAGSDRAPGVFELRYETLGDEWTLARVVE
ncbi:DUF6504 family protein [Nocardiopsis potens]|uniref:DUF6504 family protein n=1 Tax=Nocardiopsis potens TaxID=1246458 RepID=UPI0005950B7F